MSADWKKLPLSIPGSGHWMYGLWMSKFCTKSKAGYEYDGLMTKSYGGSLD